MRPKLTAGLLVGGIIVLSGGAAAAASLPNWPSHAAPAPTAGKAAVRAAGALAASSPPPTPVPSPSNTAPSSMSSPHAPAAVPSKSSAPRAAKSATASITYTVKPGDTLSGIAEWFKLHGYGALYAANRAVIGDNPNLIFPGERITIADGVMTLSKSS